MLNVKESEGKNEYKKLETFGVRHTLAVMIFSSYFITFAMRTSLSVAIVAMTTNTVSKRSNDSEFEDDTCPVPENYSNIESNQLAGEFDWSEQTKGILLGSFFYGYILTNLIGGRAGDYWGGRYVLGISVLCTSIAMIACPLSARISPTMLLVMRILQGVSAGFGFPTMSTLMAKWYPKDERSTIAAFIFSANQIGAVVSMFVTGWFSSSEYLGGWPTAFYFFGGLGIVWTVIWFLIISENPQDHPRISDAELKYIVQGCPPITERLPVPWRAILTSKVVWSIIVAHFGVSWTSATLLTKLPTYLDRVLHLDIYNNGIISCLPFLCSWGFVLVFSFIINKMFTRGLISMLSMRRTAMIVNGYLPAVGMILMCFTECNVIFALSTFVILGSFLGAHFIGVMSSPADIAPRFAGTLLGLSNTFSCVAAFVTPSLISSITQESHTLSSWRIVFIIFVFVSVSTTTFYVMFISTDVQPFNEPTFSSKLGKGKGFEKIESALDPVLLSYEIKV